MTSILLVAFYYVKHGSVPAINPAEHPEQKDMEPILFLSRRVNDAESRYWPIELEVASLVWVTRKVRHIIEACEAPIIVYTDHSATSSSRGICDYLAMGIGSFLLLLNGLE